MTIDNYVDQRGLKGISGLIFARGSFGVIESSAEYAYEECTGKYIYTYQNQSVLLRCEFINYDNGVVLRKDTLTNISSNVIEVNKLSSRFRVDGNAYEVYTQYSGWQHESRGEWQKLVTQITTETQGIRSCDGATPMMALHNLYNHKNVVFHLIPNCQWKINVRKAQVNKYECVVVETGLQDSCLKLKVEAGQTIELPQIVFFEAENKVDLDAYKLHEFFNSLYPRKRLPILYNSWLYCFDGIDIDSLKKQADAASEMGIEAFMIDAGWFGESSDWFFSVGDWEENLVYGPKGRLLELSEYIRSKGMIFGLWFELERGFYKSKAVQTHPEYFIDKTFLDYANPTARQYILQAVSKVIDKYQIGWVKFDFNATTPYDDHSQSAFYYYYQGYKEFINEFKSRYPDVYMTNCGGGGYRMDLNQAKMFDSCWFTDNQGPYDGIRIIKDTLKRLPSSFIERWNVQQYCEGFVQFKNPDRIGKMIHCNNATWDFLIGVNDSFSEGFMQGGPFGFSCDIAGFSDEYKRKWADVIAQYKFDREFFMQANARILIDSDEILVIEYSNKDFSRCIVQVFTKVVFAYDFRFYPKVDSSFVYLVDGNRRDGKDLNEQGICLEKISDNSCITINILKEGQR